MTEKIYTFPNIEPQKPMTEEEFDKWADKMMLDRACEWLQETLNEYDDGSGYLIVCSTEFATAEEFVECFLKAMEGGAE